MQHNCECGHASSEHPKQQPDKSIAARRPCQNEDCTCQGYNWDEDQGGVAVTRSVQK